MSEKLLIKNEDIFISYSSKDEKRAIDICNELEKNGNSCFFAKRDIQPGKAYAGEIIKAIEKCSTFVLILTQSSVNSHQVLREINAAVARNKLIVPLRFENVELTDDLKYYLGVSQWIDIQGDDYRDEISEVSKIIDDKSHAKSEDVSEIVYKGVTMENLESMISDGFSIDQIAMREIEIDYLCIPSEKFKMNETMEGTLEDWKYAVEHTEYETSACLIKNDTVIGYCDMYPVKQKAYEQLVNGECIIREDMIDVYGFGGTFPVYIAMIGIIPSEEGHANYFRVFDWIFEHIAYWRKKHIRISEIAISVYSDMLETFVEKLGFRYVGLNPVGGKIYKTDYNSLMNTTAVLYRYANLDLRD